jgi:hypothetical protein
VPQEWTYGEHSYNKGADMWHGLRGVMGDSAFFNGLTAHTCWIRAGGALADVPQQWTYGEHSYNKGRADVIDFNGLLPGDYTLGWKLSATRIPGIDARSALQLHHNAAQATIAVIGAEPGSAVRLLDASGRIVLNARSAGPVDVSVCAAGAYRVQVRANTGEWRLAGSFVHGR